METHEEYTFPSSVQSVMEEELPSDDVLDNPNFDAVNYINFLFPTEQSLSNIDDVVNKMELKICSIDKRLRRVVHWQTNAGQDGRAALEDAHNVIRQLFVHIKDIKDKAEQSEEVVKEITRDIKQLDFAKRNLTTSMTALNHLYMFVDGVDALKVSTQKKQYTDIFLQLQAVMEVMKHFNSYMDIPQVKQVSDKVHQIHADLAQVIIEDFKLAFTCKKMMGVCQLFQGCLVLSLLDPKEKNVLLDWFVENALQEYRYLYGKNEDFVWLGHIDLRYAWFKQYLERIEQPFRRIFPADWEICERIAVHFCNVTREDLTKLMQKRHAEIDVKLLLYAIQRTTAFEALLAKKFTGVTLENTEVPSKPKVMPAKVAEESAPGNPFEEGAETEVEGPRTSPFANLIGRCFEPYLNIYIESLDRNLADLMKTFVSDCKTQPPGTEDTDEIEGPSSVLSSCADLFVCYKKCMLQCMQLNTGAIMLSLAEIFQKYLREYAVKILQNNLPKFTGSAGIGTSMSSITRDFRDLSTSGLIQNFQSFLKEGESARFSKEEQCRICCILTTAEYCLETTQQLGEKLRERTDACYADKINFSQEQDFFHNVIIDCIQLLVHDLESTCETALTAMTKLQWSAIEVVGDQSHYVNTIVAHLRQTIPTIRDRLSSCRKYFTQLCVKFASSFIVKLVQQLYKCKPLNAIGTEQLLLDVHMLKTALLDLPSTGYQVQRKAPATYTKVVVKGMADAEMILKVVMTPIESPNDFVKQCRMRLPDLKPAEFQKILDMKGLKKTEQVLLMEQFKQPANSDTVQDNRGHIAQDSPEHEVGRIKRLEKLIKKRI